MTSTSVPPFPAAEPHPSTSRVLAGRRVAPVRKRDLIVSRCAGRDVLDLGAVQHSWRMSVENPDWPHQAIRAVARSCVGVDFLADDVAELQRRGYDMRVGDVLKDLPPGQFDVVVAGDIIEHLEDPGKFLAYVAAALRPDGVAIIATPSAFFLGQFWTILAKGKPAISPEHTVLFDPFTFSKLVDRTSLELAELHWLTPSWWAFWDSGFWVRNTVGRALKAVSELVMKRRPYLSSDFAAVLRLRPEGHERDVNRSAAEVMEFLGHKR